MLSLIFVAILPLAYSLECFNDVQKGLHRPHGSAPCQPGAQFCMSQLVSGTNLVTYLCDQPINPACRIPGCYQNESGDQVCCCNSDRCNVGIGGGVSPNVGHNNGYNNGPHNSGPGFNGWGWNSSSKLASFSSLLILLLTRA